MKGLNLLRAFFMMACAVLGWQIGIFMAPHTSAVLTYRLVGFGLGILFSGTLIGVEISFTKQYIGVVTSALLGLLGGLILSVLFIRLIFMLEIFQNSAPDFQVLLKVALLIVFSYLGIIITLQTREKFKFIIPFMELKPAREKEQELILDTNIIIDGRIHKLAESGLLPQRFVVPDFIVSELQELADSSEKTKRIRGRRGLDMLEEMKNSSEVKIEIRETNLSYVDTVDEKLIQYARAEALKILSNDYALTKVASVEGVKIINLNKVVKSLKKSFTPGESVQVKLTKQGEEQGQGVGYLEDGTMIVVEEGEKHIGENVKAKVTSSIETQAGQMIFAEL